MSDKIRKIKVVSKDLLARSPEPRKSAALAMPRYDEEKIEVEIRDIIRVKPSDFAAIKNSYAEWASMWS